MKRLLIICFLVCIPSLLCAEVNFQNTDWTQFLGARHSFIIKQIGIPDHMYPKRYSANEKEDDIVFIYRGAGVDMRFYLWNSVAYRIYFSDEHTFNIYKGIRMRMTKDQIESILGPVNTVTDKGLHLWKQGNVKLIVDFKDGTAKECFLSLNER